MFERILWVQCAVLLAVLIYQSRQWILGRARAWLAVSPNLAAVGLLSVLAAGLLFCCSVAGLDRAQIFVLPLAVLLYPLTPRLINKWKLAEGTAEGSYAKA